MKTKTLAQRLEDIEVQEKISGNELARTLGMATNDYHNKYKKNDKPPTLWQRIALTYIERFGLGLLRKLNAVRDKG